MLALKAVRKSSKISERIYRLEYQSWDIWDSAAAIDGTTVRQKELRKLIEDA